MNERKEALFRLLVFIVTGIILWAWAYLVGVLAFVHWIIVLVTNKRNKDIAEFLEYWSTTSYNFYRYMTGMSNERPFPFTDLNKISKFKK